MILQYFAFAAIGKLLLYLAQKFPLTGYIAGKWKILEELVTCDLCFGFWVYLVLGLFYRIDIFPTYHAILSEIILASVTSFLVHLISIGWSEKFNIVVIN